MATVTHKLYRVTCRGMTSAIADGPINGIAYVIATNPDDAYQKVRKRLDADDCGFRSERELACIELLAEDVKYPDCRIVLYL